MSTRSILILGSTGNLGKQSLEVIEKYPEKFKVFGLVAQNNATLLAKQSEKHQATHASLSSQDPDFLFELISDEQTDLVLNFIPGLAGLPATLTALQQGKTLLTANKESLIAEGKKIMKLAQPGQLIPLDSEHNAIDEILHYADHHFGHYRINKITLPCSGGSLLGRKSLDDVTLEEVLAHPRWNMGDKVTVESALLLNKGFEIIEAHYLFNLPIDQIQAKIHPECQMHGAVEIDIKGQKKQLAYLSDPDMREHIENGLLRACGDGPVHPKIKEITPEFLQKLPDPDHEAFPGIQLALRAFKNGKIKEFLQHEELLIQEFLQRKITLPELLSALSKIC